MRTLKLTLSYDGTNYVGWQRQENGLSVQQVVEEAFVPLVGAGEPPTVAGAGRTDAGVHALAQVASATLDLDLTVAAIRRALNVRLPADVRVLDVEDARPGFHAQFHASGKSYRYRLAMTPVVSPFDRWFVWHVPDLRGISAMRQAADALVGTHDFASFQAGGTAIRETTRTLSRVTLVERDGELHVEVDGDGFLRHMVRIIVGTLVEVGAGSRAPGDL
ncbi:MAG: tRNA pseudouridine(38-40) synthase TruA, partial [Vicinamibacterales bacterium]